jgi:hypothetical protein
VSALSPRRRWIFAGLIAVELLGIVVALWLRHRIDPLPAPVRDAVEAERAARPSIDSQLVAATLEAQAAQERQDAATQRAEAAERRARIQSARADSLAREAELATTARDSALYWHLAYSARTEERDTLLVASAAKDSAIAAANARAFAFARRAAVADSARLRADSVLDAVVASVTVCTVPGTFGRVRCPSRTAALAFGFVGGLVLEETVRAVHDGRLRIPLPIPHR